MGVLKTISEPKGAGHFISGDYDANQSAEHITLAPTAVELPSGTMLGQITRGNQAVAHAANVGNTGDGVFAAAPTADAGAAPGDYTLTVIEPAANGGTILVLRPDGTQDGVARIGVPYDVTVNFTLNDGPVDVVAGDGFKITVSYAAGSGQFKPVDPVAIDGSQNFAGILWERRGISAATQRAVAVVRGPVVVNGRLLTYVTAANAGQQAAIEEQSVAAGVIVRR